MKRFILFSFSVLLAGALFAQQQTVQLANTQATITPDEIVVMGQNANSSRSSVIVLNFEGLGNSDAILEFYNGGLSQQGYSGPDVGVEFLGNALSIIDADAGGTGNIANEPSPSTVLFWLTGSSAGMNVPAGFSNGFSFFYSINTSPGFVQVYSGLNGTGNLLASATLPINWNVNCTGDPTGGYCHWDPVGITFSGVAKSIFFGGVANQCAFDEITFGSDVPGYETPVSNWAIFIGIGLILMFAFFRAWRISRA
jgi:hypothetical protein